VRHRLSLIGTSLAVALVAACSSSASKSSPTPSTAKSATSVTAGKCVPPDTGGAVVATRVAGVQSDWTMSSFDGAKIRLHWFPAPNASGKNPKPTVLMGPGWGLAGDTRSPNPGLFGAISVDGLNHVGYNVLTWDPRGFGVSTGTVETDSVEYEGRDVERMIDWIATRPGVELDGPRDPRVGMAGGSYGGGIQLIAAAIDCRIDAITPLIAWHSLTTSLDKNGTPKNGWSSVLISATKGRSVDPHIPSAYREATTTAVIDPADKAWFRSRGPGDLVSRITAPTLVVQGTVDNLFTLDEGITNYRILRDHGVPSAMVWFCGGHGICLTKAGSPALVSDAVITWLNRYVKRDATVDTGPAFRFVDQNGKLYTASAYPVALGAPLGANGAGTLSLVAGGGSGPAHQPASGTDVVGGIAAVITPAKAANAVDVRIATPGAAVVVGAPQLSLSYTGTAGPGTRPTWVFAQLVDDATGIVLGNQVTPIPVTLDGKPHQTSLSLEDVAFTTRSGSHLTLQLVATTVAYAPPRLGGSVHFDKIGITLPVAADLTPE
jgi:ABC-2 type transport system ATP-binding protein